jgi:hypothetical protein
MTSTGDFSPPPAKLEQVSIDDFTTGLVGGLAALGINTVSTAVNENFYLAAIDAFEEFDKIGPEYGVKPWFQLVLDSHYKDCPDFRSALARATGSGLITWDGPDYTTFRSAIQDKDAAECYFRYLTGGKELYVPVARAFRLAYERQR